MVMQTTELSFLVAVRQNTEKRRDKRKGATPLIIRTNVLESPVTRKARATLFRKEGKDNRQRF